MKAISSRRALLCGAATLPLMAGPAFATPQSDVQRRCHFAIQWGKLANSTDREPWSDDRMNAELAGYFEELDFTIDEPSRSLADLRSKASLALWEFEDAHFCSTDPAENARIEAELDRGTKLLRVVLKEVIALCA